MEATVEMPKAFSVRDDRELSAHSRPDDTVEITGTWSLKWRRGCMSTAAIPSIGASLHGRPAVDGCGCGNRRVKEAGAGRPTQRRDQARADWVNNEPGVTETPPV